MSIEFTCGCGKRYSVKDGHAGKRARCHHCGQELLVPSATPTEQQTSVTSSDGWNKRQLSLVSVGNRELAKDADRTLPEPRTWRDYLYLLLLAAMIPRVVHTFRTPEPASLRLERMTARSSPEVLAVIEAVKEHLGTDGPLPDFVLPFLPADFYQALPAGRIDGALLSRQSKAHWAMAALSGTAFVGLFIVLFARRIVHLRHLLIVGVFTATVGLLLLITLQHVADATRGWVLVGGGILAIPFWVLKLLAGSYDLAFDPNANLFLSAFGFTISVGFLEEATKALPLVWHMRVRGTLGWRGMCLWGLTSGAAFGVAEGIMYSGSYYNGILETEVYAVRFLSRVALHAVWTGSVGIIVFIKRKELEQVEHWFGYLNAMLSVIVLSMLLHGLYDTFLKKEHELLALLTAVASFVVLALQIEHMRKKETAYRVRAVPVASAAA